MQTEFVFKTVQKMVLDSWKSRTLLKVKRSFKKMRNLEPMLRKPFSDLMEQILNCLFTRHPYCLSGIIRA